MLESGGQRPQGSPPKSWERRAPYQAVGAGWTAPPRQAEEEIHLGIPLRNLAGHNLAGEESKGDSRKIRQLPLERCPVPYFRYLISLRRSGRGSAGSGSVRGSNAAVQVIPNISHAEPQRPQRTLGVQRYRGYCGIGPFPAPPGTFCPPRPEKSGTFSAGSACLCVAPVCVANATGRRRQASLREQLQHLGSAVSNQPSAR